MKNLLFKKGYWLRYFRLALALMLFMQANETGQWFYILFGLFFWAQALFNFGCGLAGCDVHYKDKNQQ